MDDNRIRQYFLTSQKELRQEDLDLTADPEVFSLVEEVESELVDDYVLGLLSEFERKAFETHYLVTPARRAKVAETERLVQVATDRGSAREADHAIIPFKWFSTNKLVLGAAAAIFLISVIFILVGIRDREALEVARLEKPAEMESTVETTAPIRAPLNNLEKSRDKSLEKDSAKLTSAIISISPRNFRGSGREIVITKEDASSPFLLKLETDPGTRLFSTYVLKIETPEGVLIQSSSTIVSKSKSGVTVSIVGSFEPATYIVYLVGVEKNEETQPVGEYVFRVIEK